MKLLKLLSLLIPILATAHGQSSVSLGLSRSTTTIDRRSQISEDEGGTVEICLNTNLQSPSTTSTVLVRSEDGTATAPDDYNSVSATLTFNTDESTEECVTVTLATDDLDEPDEYLIVRINGQTGDYSNFQAVVNISISGGSNGGSSVGISLEQDSYVISETEGSVEVCAVQNGVIPFGDTIVVLLTTASASGSSAATVGSDYTELSQQLVFNAASPGTRHCVNISIIQDELEEGSEEFQVNLRAQNAAVFGSFIGPTTTATVTVTDMPTVTTTEPTDGTTEPPSEPTDDATEPTDDTTEPTPGDGGVSEDPTTGGGTDSDDTTSTPPGGDSSNTDPPNTGSDPNNNGGPNPSPDGSVSEDNSTPQTVGVADDGVMVKSLSLTLLLLASCLGLLL